MKWLVSYSFRTHEHVAGRYAREGRVCQAIEAIDVHPAVWFAAHLERNKKPRPMANASPVHEYREEVLAILSAVEIPIGTLTDEQIAAIDDR